MLCVISGDLHLSSSQWNKSFTNVHSNLISCGKPGEAAKHVSACAANPFCILLESLYVWDFALGCFTPLCFLCQVKMQFIGRLLDTVSSVSTLFTNPYRVRDVPVSDYGGGGKVKVKEDGRMYLYKNTQCQSWDCLLMCPETPTTALRLVLITSHWRTVVFCLPVI